VRFANQADNQQFVIVGVAKDLQLNPRQVGGGFLYTYKLVNLNSFDWWRVCVWSILLLNQFIFMRDLRFQLRWVFCLLGYDILGGYQHFRGACWLHLLMFIENSTHPLHYTMSWLKTTIWTFTVCRVPKIILWSPLGICEKMNEWKEESWSLFVNN